MEPKKLVFTIALCFIWYLSSVAQQKDSTKIINKIEYTCSMHPEVISNTSGYCPKCGMKLIEKDSRKETVVQAYTCSMHPEIILDKPGKCPKCGMNLILKTDGSNNHMGCEGMMNGENGHPMRYVTIGVIAMIGVMLLFALR